MLISKDSAGLVNAIIAAAAGLTGVAVGGWVAHLNNKHERRQRLLHQKLEEFYGPMLATRNQIRAKSELRLKLSQLAGEEWTKLFEAAGNAGPEQLKQIDQERSPDYERLIEYENKQLREEILPAYKEMVRLFTAKMHLAEPSTRVHLPELINFVEVWDRWIDQSLPREVLRKLDHSEKLLNPLYEDLEKRFAALQRQLSS